MKQQSTMPQPDAGMPKKHRPGTAAPEVVSITNAATAHSEEMRQRMIKYGITMGIRMVCLAAIFVFDGWYRIIPVVGAVVLPWVAVMLANGGADLTKQETVELLDQAPLTAISSGQAAADDAVPSDEEPLTGELVPDEEQPAADPAGAETSGSPKSGADAEQKAEPDGSL